MNYNPRNRRGQSRPKRDIWEALMEESTPERPGICDYEGSNYRTEFWEGQGRDYEDKVERIALKKLLPVHGTHLLEIGAGFGRLTNEYVEKYDKIVLLDYSFSQLEYAREHLGDSDKFTYVAADAYQLPFRAGMFDGVSMIRTIHHMSNVNAVLRQVANVLSPGGTFILEHANKRNMKAIARYLLRRQAWSPYSHEPHEFVELNFVFHPHYMRDMLALNGFDIQMRMPVSFFRVGALKKWMPLNLMVNIDALLQRTGAFITPSIFIKAARRSELPYPKEIGTRQPTTRDIDPLFACPTSGGPLVRDGDMMVSLNTGMRYAVRDGIYDFKVAVNE